MWQMFPEAKGVESGSLLDVETHGAEKRHETAPPASVINDNQWGKCNEEEGRDDKAEFPGVIRMNLH